MIHPTATIHRTAVLEGDISIAAGTVIGPLVVLQGNISIGENNRLGPGGYFSNTVRIGDNNHFLGQCAVGGQGEMGTKGDILREDGVITIGSDNLFREFVTINSPVRRSCTTVGDHGYYMARSHIAHDCQVANNVTMAHSLLAGGVIVGAYAYIGLGSMTHQWLDIGESAMIGMLAANTRLIPPFAVVTGVPARILKFNRVGAERRGLDPAAIAEVDRNYRAILEDGGKTASDNPIVRTIATFLSSHEGYLKTFAGA
ncbi:MAG: hypothetical protein A2284_06845 [Deltaproteobacteria bacterium RIFOXYA12_FULL_61_11]|nr:MAG: hypothetical protein A2284_06845 [Deltaproteobacteria bacterium RIFOXYA12_FULL_61_11]